MALAYDVVDPAMMMDGGMELDSMLGAEMLPQERQVSLEDLARGGDDGVLDISRSLDDERLTKIGREALEGWRRDKASRTDWEEQTKAAFERVGLKPKRKDYPWPNAASVNVPILTRACVEFAARTMPGIVRDERVVKARVVGKDPQGQKLVRAERVAEFMSWQLREGISDWVSDTDAMLHQLPVAGCAFRKVSWSRIDGEPKCEFVSPLYVVVHNSTRSLDTAARITQEFELLPHEIVERQRVGDYREIDLRMSHEGDERSPPQKLIEQHTLLDMDEDGYPEPWVVTVHVDSQTVLAIQPCFWPQDVMRNRAGRVLRIKRRSYFVYYGFIPDLEGGFYGLGLGRLLAALSETVDGAMNQLLDAGHMSNLGGGFIGRELRFRGSQQPFRPGEWRTINAPGGDVRAAIVSLPVPGPSPVLFQLLGSLMDQADKVAGLKDVLTGDVPNTAPVGTTLALIEQGLQVYTAIYARIYNALRREFKMLFELNGAYLDEQTYLRVLDDPQANFETDWDPRTSDVAPVSDPKSVTNAQAMAKADVLARFLGDPLLNQQEIRMRILRAANIEDADALMAPQEQGPNPAMEAQAEKVRAEAARLGADAAVKSGDARIKHYQADMMGAPPFGQSMGAMGAQDGPGQPPPPEGAMGGMDPGPEDAAPPPGLGDLQGAPPGGMVSDVMGPGPSGPAEARGLEGAGPAIG